MSATAELAAGLAAGPLPAVPRGLPGAPASWLLAVAAVTALLTPLAGSRKVVAALVAQSGAAVVLALAVTELVRVWQGSAFALIGTVGALPWREIAVPLQLRVDATSALLAVVVALVALVVQVYGSWYLHHDPRYRSFAATTALFTAAMLLLVHADDLLLVLVGWELMGWCSFLLIGHESQRPAARAAAVRALLTTRLADIPFVLGLVILAVGAGTTSLSAAVDLWSRGAVDQPGLLATAMVLIVLGVAGKSAQFPFHDWLPRAMEGPTPASALIHAATMVAAGTVVLTRLLPLLTQADAARLVLAVLAAVSVVGGAVLAFLQPDLKRLLAWSTISQVGLMLTGLATVSQADGAAAARALLSPDNPVLTPGGGAALLALTGHAAYKALLFLVIGWAGVLVGGTTAQALSGAVRHHPDLHRPAAIGLLALAGVPPLVGLVAKEGLLTQASDSVVDRGGPADWVALAAVGLSIPLTAAYCMRVWATLSHRTPTEQREHEFVVADSRWHRDVSIVEMLHTEAVEPEDDLLPAADPAPVEGDPRDLDDEEGEAYLPGAWRTGLLALEVLCLLGGLLIFTPLVDSPLLVERIGAGGLRLHVDWAVAGASLALMAAAALVVQFMASGSAHGDPLERLPASWARHGARGLGLGEAAQALVAAPVMRLARTVRWLDETGFEGWARRVPAVLGSAAAVTALAHRRAPVVHLAWVVLGLVVLGALGVATA